MALAIPTLHSDQHVYRYSLRENTYDMQQASTLNMIIPFYNQIGLAIMYDSDDTI